MPTLFAPLIAVFLSTFFSIHLLTPMPAYSWFDKGHRIVGIIAEAHLTAEARKEIGKILFGGMTLAEASIWPDHEGCGHSDGTEGRCFFSGTTIDERFHPFVILVLK